MATSDITHFNLLNRWPVIMHVNGYHFNQVSGASAPLNSPCTVWTQSQRDTVAQALYEAGHEIADALGFFPRPTWVTEDIPLGLGQPYYLQQLRTKYRYVQAFGQRATTLLFANQAVTYSDSNSDGINDTATITFATTITDTTELQVFFRVADGAPGAADERWQIEPLTVTISAGTATITGPRYLFVKPSTVWAVPFSPTDVSYLQVNNADIQLAANFVSQVDVYRVYNDTTTSCQLLSDPIYTQLNNLGTMLTDTADVLLIDGSLGLFKVRAQSATCNQFDRVRVWYKAGLPLVNGAMDRRLETAIIRYANTLFPYYPCDICDNPEGPTRTMFDEDRRPMPANEMRPNDLGNPFGLKRGMIEIWRRLRHLDVPIGGKV